MNVAEIKDIEIRDDETRSILEFFAEDHDRLDELFKNFQNLRKQINELESLTEELEAEAKEFFKAFKLGLQRHIAWEEEVLFPAFEKTNGHTNTGPTFVMRSEHKNIKEELEKIHKEVREGTFESEHFESNLLELLSAHNEKEEKILYPWVDKSLGDSFHSKIYFEMKNI